MNQQVSLGSVINSSIYTTALLANRLIILSKGESMFHEEDYLQLVPEFQRRIQKLIMPPKTHVEFKAEADKFIKEILSQFQGAKDDANDRSGDDDQGASTDVDSR
jgi:hypothetical protein